MNAASCCSLLIVLLLWAGPLLAQKFDEKFEHWPVDLRINGTIIAANALADASDANSLFLKASGGKNATIVGLFLKNMNGDELDSVRKVFESAKSVELIKVDPAAPRIPDEFLGKLKDAGGVMLISGDTLHGDAREQIVALREQLFNFVRRGGVIYTEGALTKLLGNVEITGGKRLAQIAAGLALIPDSVIETKFSNQDDMMRVKSALVSHPRIVGLGIEKNSAVVLSGRKLRVVGDGNLTVMLAANQRQPFRVQKIAKQNAPRQSPKEYLVDLTQWRREAIDRTIDLFPPAVPDKPFVENGSLVIVGGGGMPKGLMDRFVELAGGADRAKLVYVPCSERDTVSARQGIVEMWRRMGVKHATFIHTKDRVKANRDQEFLAPLKEATGIWFGGGRQWNFADSYYGTTAHKLMKEVVRRGGVAGGSSAGASIQARYLARATPIQNFDIMAPGYERGGLGFISGVAIDQHFSQRGRQKDMTQLVNRYPQMLGIGLDEATAIIVRGSTAEVVGRGKAHFYDRNLPVFPERPDFVALPAASQYDLAARKTMMRIDANYPGGNIIVDRIEGDHVYVHPDLRDTQGDWFYWNFRIRGAAGRTLTVHFTGSNVIGVRGPAVSSDGGKSWRWLGIDALRDQSFRYECDADEDEVRFCFAIPYVQSNLDEFLTQYREHPNLRVETLCKSKKGRDVKRFHLGCLDANPNHRVLITCRHHCCEMMASYSLEGLLSAVLADSDDGRWLREHVELLAIPLMDKDGVQDGDQGKNRKPRDHNRDYSGDSIHPEVKALREFVPKWSEDRLRFALDMHDPWIRGDLNEIIYLVENDGPTTDDVRKFASTLEASRQGPLPFRAKDNLAFGTAWNTAKNYEAGMSFSRWASTQPNIRFAATVEIPYANVNEEPVTPESARAFGADLARALRKFLESQ